MDDQQRQDALQAEDQRCDLLAGDGILIPE
jgi:hypothetical protein